MKPETKQTIDDLIASKKVFVISKSYCPYCVKAKKVLQNHVGKDLAAEAYQVMEIEGNSECDDIQNYMNKLTGGRSVPRVFVNGKFLGGCDDLVALDSKGGLAKLLA